MKYELNPKYNVIKDLNRMNFNNVLIVERLVNSNSNLPRLLLTLSCVESMEINISISYIIVQYITHTDNPLTI